jgi:UDP-N-acetylmuramate dehydrogenase
VGGDLEKLEGLLGPLGRRDVPIGALTTYRVGGVARLWCEPATESDLARLCECLSAVEVPILVLGMGSNLLVADAGWPGICVHLGTGHDWIEVDGTEVRAGASAAYPVLARRSAAAGLAGMEWAVGIPGSVGGAVRMNAGGHGADTRQRLVSARVIHLRRGTEAVIAVGDLDMSYRHSAIEAADLVVSASYALDEGSPEEGAARISEIVRWRRQNQPGGQNAGSVFTNPAGDSAGRLIDAAGLKGYRIGSAAVSEKHANFIQADANGSADDVLRLVDHVRQTVAAITGVSLEVELKTAGWDPSLSGADPSCS